MNPIRFAATCFALLIAVATASATDLPLVGDAHVNSTRTTTNYGTSSNLYVGGGNTSFVQFDTMQLPAGTTSSQVSKATLLVFVNRVNASAAVSVNAVTSPWSEGAVTFANMPTVSSTVSGTFTPTTAGVYIAVDVTALVQGWVSGTTANNGIALTSASGNVLFDSKENDQTAHPARLNVTLSTTLPTISGGGISYGTGSTGSISVNNSNPLAPVITATLPTVVQSIAVASSTGNATPSVTVDNTTTPTTPKITVNFPAAAASTSSGSLEFSGTNSAGFTTTQALGGTTYAPPIDQIIQSPVLGTFDVPTSTYTVGVAGNYEVIYYCRGNNAAQPTNSTAALPFIIVNGTFTDQGSFQYPAAATPANDNNPTRAVASLISVRHYNVGDKVALNITGSNSSVQAVIPANGLSYSIVKF